MITAAASKISNYCSGTFKHFVQANVTSHMNKSTLVLGASLKDNRYSNICVKTLISGHFQVSAIGLREGFIDETEVHTGFPEFRDIHTVTLYLGPQNQPPWYEYILKLNPKRVIFNPETENEEFQIMLANAGIDVIEDCTIVMVQSGRY